MSNSYIYAGDELFLFSNAMQWKKYFSSKICRYLKGDVLEVGAGIGGVLNILYSSEFSSWTCLEPDAENVKKLGTVVGNNDRLSNVKILLGTTRDLKRTDLYDTILYVDVLEHIQNDKDEMFRIQKHLTGGGNLIILAPALNCLYSEFDKSIGHYRRYDKKGLQEILPEKLHAIEMFYLDSLGVFLSLANKLILKNRLPTPGQIKFWDNLVVPCSIILDKVIRYRIGKTIVGVFGKGE